MGKHYYKDFELSMDVHSDIICNALSEMWGGRKFDENYVSWNYFGNYIMYYDGDNVAYYFTKHYLRISGWDLMNKDEIERCFKYLKLTCE